MERRGLGKTGLHTSILGFGASSLGAEFRRIDLSEALQSVRTAVDHGINLIDTSPYYGRGQSEVLLGHVLPEIPRDDYILSTKLGRYAPQHFDFSAKRVEESVDISLERMKVEHIDILFCHDIEFVPLQPVIEETLPALDRLKQKGKVKWIGVSGYPMKIFQEVASQFPLDVILSYNHFTLQNDMLQSLVPEMKSRGVGILNAAPFSARLLTDAPLPSWHKATKSVRETCRRAAEHCRQAGSELAKLALQFSIRNDDLASCIVGSANPGRVAQWAQWVEEPIDEDLLAEVQAILQPIHNWFYDEGLPENRDPATVQQVVGEGDIS